MLDNLKTHLARVPEAQRLNNLREYLQWLILKSIDANGFRKNLFFIGGTALRVIYKIERFSEDLDFSFMGSDKFDVTHFSSLIARDIARYGLEVEVTQLKTIKTVRSFFLKFQNLLYPLGIAPEKNRVISIKIEVDTNPPKGAKLEEYFFPDSPNFWVTHADLPSLFSGKMGAFLFRKYVKGRDFYDLFFFLRKKVRPNFELFQGILKQSVPEIQYESPKSVFLSVVDRVNSLDMAVVLKDLRPFLQNLDDEAYLNKETLIKLLEQGGYLESL